MKSEFTRQAAIVALCIVVSSILVAVAQHLERSRLARAETEATVTRADESASDLDDLDRIVTDVRGSTSRWLAVYLPLLTLGTAMVVAAGSRRRGPAVLTCAASLTPVVAAAVAVTAPFTGVARGLPLLYVAVGVAVTLVAMGRTSASPP